MLKFISCGIVLLLIVVISGYVFFNNRARIYVFNEGDLIDFRFHSRHDVDTSGLRGEYKIVEGTPFTQIFILDAVLHGKGS